MVYPVIDDKYLPVSTHLEIDSFLDEYGLVYGTLKGEKDSKTIGLIAHVDTALECKGGNFIPRVIENYDGKDIVLNDEVTIKG